MSVDKAVKVMEGARSATLMTLLDLVPSTLYFYHASMNQRPKFATSTEYEVLHIHQFSGNRHQALYILYSSHLLAVAYYAPV